MRKLTFWIFSTIIVIALALFATYTFGSSPNPCSPCHVSYYQYLDLVEGASKNQIPSELNINETKTVAVTVENLVNTDRYSSLSNVAVTVSSIHGHFSVASPTVTFSDMPPGKQIASLQITGISDGYDYLSITVTGYNTHRSDFWDSYSPLPLITVGNATGPPPSPPSTPVPTSPTTPNTNPPSTTTNPSPSTSPPTTNKPAEPSPQTNQPVQSLSINLSSPTEGKILHVQTAYEIRWNASGGEAPLKVTISYRTTETEWTTIATELPIYGFIDWEPPKLATNVEISVLVTDSATPSKSASVNRTFEILSNSEDTESAQLPVLPIAVIMLSVAAVGAVISLHKRRSDKKNE